MSRAGPLARVRGPKRLQGFASPRKYSWCVVVTLVENQQVEPLMRTLAEHSHAFGGVLDWNPVFAEALTWLGPTAEVCRPYRANQKGALENLMGWLQRSFFKTRQFLDRQDLQLQLGAWHELPQAFGDAALWAGFKRDAKWPTASVSSIARDVRGLHDQAPQALGSRPARPKPRPSHPRPRPQPRPHRLPRRPVHAPSPLTRTCL